MLLYQEDAELLFPPRIIPLLRDLRGDEFGLLVDQITDCQSEADTEVLGFSLMMVRLARCMTCTADSYRAMRGCTNCAQKVIRGYNGTDQELAAEYQDACHDVDTWKQQGTVPRDL